MTRETKTRQREEKRGGLSQSGACVVLPIVPNALVITRIIMRRISNLQTRIVTGEAEPDSGNESVRRYFLY